MKTCRQCNNTLSLSDFYRHEDMADGHLNKCKVCIRANAKANRQRRIEYYREYDRQRGARQSAEYLQAWRTANPDKYRAHTAVNNAVRDGRLAKAPCEICGATDRLHAHHHDYSKPLDVSWLCAAHHRQHHVKEAQCR